jgi:microcystin-dependent protein
MSEPFLGEMKMVGFNFAPVGWAFCQGQTMAISQNTALFSLLGTVYGGDGRVTFGLPDLRGRSPVGMGQGPGLTNVAQGELAGTESVTLTTANMPAHNHPATVQVAGTATEPGNTPSQVNNVLGASSGGPGTANIWSTTMNNPVAMAGVQTGLAGANQPVSLRNPFLGVNFVIALEGIYPQRP